MQKSKHVYVKAGHYYIREDLILGIEENGSDCNIFFTDRDDLFVTEKAKTILKRMNVNVKE